ncbi:MAG: PKD domain-containing protein [Flavobacteriales bacterium]|nr:PKD domain-containing protein [Flavobacteriales bacterium]
MRTTLRSLTLVLAGAFGLAAFAQPTPPYPILITGYVQGCMPNSQVNIASMPGAQPTWNYTLDLVNCGFDTVAWMQSPGGGFVITVPCNGALLTAVGQYQVDPSGSDSIMVVLNCGGGGTPDCLGVPGGSALPGTACTTALGQAGVWSADCECLTNALVDCEGIPNGPAMPGTPCTNPATGLSGFWSPDCVCQADTMGGNYDCLGVLNGSNLPGTPCWTPGTNFIGTWDANCNCTNGGGLPCQAGFWVIQAYGQDSLPVPNEVWVWNLSTGNGALTYLWNFGDGTSSTSAFPTHTYSQNGPYLLCLTIADASGCTSTTCDTISIGENGLLNGMILGGHQVANTERTDGFTLNVQNPLTTSIADMQELTNAAIWPNPSNGDLNLALVATADGLLRVSFFDVNGREVRQESRTMNAGRSQHRFDTNDLPAGIYTLRATDSKGHNISIRFVKAD